VLAVIAAAMLMSLGCEDDGGGSAPGRTMELPDEVVTDFVTEESDSGRVQWRLSAPRASRFKRTKVFKMASPRVEFYDEFGNLQSTLTADSGQYFDTSHDMLAYGDVVVVTVDGDVLETDSLRYLNEEDKIVNDCFNRLTRGRDLITGYGLECDHSLSSVDIKRDVEARLVDEGGILEDERNIEQSE
jgi:LPS export ABC transporter protein LptC